MSQKQRTNTRGFTLLELLMVVIIIAILAAIAVPQYIRTVERSRMSEAVSILGQMRGAQIRHNAEFGTFAAAVNNLDMDPGDLIGTPQYTYTVGASSNGDSIAVRIGGAVGNCVASYTLTLTAAGVWTGRDCQS